MNQVHTPSRLNVFTTEKSRIHPVSIVQSRTHDLSESHSDWINSNLSSIFIPGYTLSQPRKLHPKRKGRINFVQFSVPIFLDVLQFTVSKKSDSFLRVDSADEIAAWLRRLTHWATCCRLIHPYAACSYVCLRSTAHFLPLSCLACHQGNNNILETIISTCKGLHPAFSHRLQH